MMMMVSLIIILILIVIIAIAIAIARIVTVRIISPFNVQKIEIITISSYSRTKINHCRSHHL